MNVYLYSIDDFKLIDSLLTKSKNQLNSLFVYFKKNQKLVSIDFSKKYEISNYAYLDKLNDAKKIDYSIEFL